MENFKENFKIIFGSSDIRKRIFITIIALVLFLIGSNITIPNIKVRGLENINEFSFFGVLNLLGGGGLRRFSFFALGISPYITATIIINLLSTDLVPPLKRLVQAGEKGKAKVDFITKTLTLGIGVAQSFAILRGLAASNYITYDTSNMGHFYIIVILLAGSFVTVWIGNMISKKGLGNGISLIVFAGVVSRLPTSFGQMFNFLVNTEDQQQALAGGLQYTVYLLGFLFLIMLIIFFQESVRKIPVQHSRASFASRSEELAYIPIKMNPSGIMPLIFATAAISTPTTIANFLEDGTTKQNMIDTLSLKNWSGMGIYAAMIVIFSFFYNQIAVNSQQLSENFLKQNTYIPGIRPGEETRKYIQKTVTRISLVGSIFLIFIALLPLVVTKLANLTSGIMVSGTGMIIVVNVAIQFFEQIKGLVITYRYKRETDIFKKASFGKKVSAWFMSDSLKAKEIVEEKEEDSGDSILW